VGVGNGVGVGKGVGADVGIGVGDEVGNGEAGGTDKVCEQPAAASIKAITKPKAKILFTALTPFVKRIRRFYHGSNRALHTI